MIVAPPVAVAAPAASFAAGAVGWRPGSPGELSQARVTVKIGSCAREEGTEEQPADLARARAMRADGPVDPIVVPYTEGDVAHELGQLEEFLLLVGGYEDPDLRWPPLPAPLAGRELLDVVARLAMFVGRSERKPPVLQPVAPDGRTELVPLFFVPMHKLDRSVIAAGHAVLEGARDHEALAEALSEWTAAGATTAADPMKTLARLRLLVQLEWDDHMLTVHRRLGSGAWDLDEGSTPVVLTDAEAAAYHDVTERLLSAWHGNDPFQRFVYRGSVSAWNGETMKRLMTPPGAKPRGPSPVHGPALTKEA